MAKFKLSFFLMVFISTTCHPQNCFENFIESDDGVVRETMHVVETCDHGFIVSCCACYDKIFLNDMLVRITADGEITNRLVFQINEKNLKYCGLYNCPDHDDEYLAIAVLTSGNSYTSYYQNELAFLRFDLELNLISQNICSLGDDYINMATYSQMDLPRFVMGDDGTLFMAAHCLKTDGYCYLFAQITPEGEIVRIMEETSINEHEDFLFDLFARDNGGYGMIKVYNHDHGGDFYYTVDSSMNCVRVARLSGMTIMEVQSNPQYLDTTFYYTQTRGSGVAYDDTTFLITCSGNYLRHIGGNQGKAHFIARVNDSLDVLEAITWESIQSSFMLRLVACVKALSVSDNAIFHCGINGLHGHGQIYTNSFTKSVISVSKFDKEMNLVWRRHYSTNNNMYDMNVIQATEDGGCIITGISAPEQDFTSRKMSYVLKLNAEGYDGMGESADIIAKPYYYYPNPAQDNLYIEFSPDVRCLSIEIYSLDGNEFSERIVKE